jgi:pimeloyl-ACP methyl ester carboxylesterase
LLDSEYRVEAAEITERLKKEGSELKDFILCGHSLGGYFMGNYALKYPTYIKKLILLSPIGMRP